jgi:PIN domain
MSLTYILVDFDNVKPSAADIGLAHGDKYRLAVVRGPQQTRYEADLAEALHGMGNQVTFTRCAKAGKNAADMQIAFHLGEVIATLPAGSHRNTRFVVISRDKDFDPLLMYLQAKGFDATRAASFKAALGGKAAEPQAAKTPTARKAVAKKVPAVKKAALVQPVAKKAVHAAARTPSKKAAPDPIARVIEGLQRKGDERPGKRKGLERFIESHLGRNLAPGQIDALLAQLERDDVLAFKDNKVEYRLPKAKK